MKFTVLGRTASVRVIRPPRGPRWPAGRHCFCSKADFHAPATFIAIAAAILTCRLRGPLARRPTADASAPASRTGWAGTTCRANRGSKPPSCFQNAIDIDPDVRDAALRTRPRQHGVEEIRRAQSPRCRAAAICTARRPGRQFSNAAGSAALPPRPHDRNRRTDPADPVGPADRGQAQDMLRQLAGTSGATSRTAIAARRRRRRSNRSVPAWLSLALGSALFPRGPAAPTPSVNTRRRSPPTAAPAKRTTISPSCISKRDESQTPMRRCKAAKKAGFKVNPQLEQAIKERLKNLIAVNHTVRPRKLRLAPP